MICLFLCVAGCFRLSAVCCNNFLLCLLGGGDVAGAADLRKSGLSKPFAVFVRF